MAFIGLGVSGGIGAYKAVEVARLLQKRGHRVRAVMTRTARRFVGPLTFEAITRERVITSQFEPGMNAEIEHISLASDMSLLLSRPRRPTSSASSPAALRTTFCLPSISPRLRRCSWRRP
jgi:phosphopantothenoylcysteine decarboxylase/phosphopantothenate--cysteine ligase